MDRSASKNEGGQAKGKLPSSLSFSLGHHHMPRFRVGLPSDNLTEKIPHRSAQKLGFSSFQMSNQQPTLVITLYVPTIPLLGTYLKL